MYWFSYDIFSLLDSVMKNIKKMKLHINQVPNEIATNVQYMNIKPNDTYTNSKRTPD